MSVLDKPFGAIHRAGAGALTVDNFRGADGDWCTLLGMALEDIAGYSLRRGLGSGSIGAVWLVRDLASGRHAVLKRIPADSVPAVQAFRDDLVLAQSIDHPHVARLIEIRQTEPEWLLISQYVAAGTLTALLQRRGPLSRGELVTLISPLAQALGAVHRAGLTHGHLGPGDVMFDADGRPVITDAGLRLQAARGEPADDLAALLALTHEAGGEPDIFTPDLFAADGDEVSQRVLRLAAPEPINLGFEPTTPSHPPASSVDRQDRDGPGQPHLVTLKRSSTPEAIAAPTTRRRGFAAAIRRGLRTRSSAYGVLASAGLAAVIVVLIGLVTIGVLDRPASRSPSASTTGPSTAGPSSAGPNSPSPVRTEEGAGKWLETLQALDARRSQAFWTLDAAGLDSVYVPGTSPWQSDRSLLGEYRDRQLRIDGLRLQIENVVIEQPGAGTVVLRIVDHLVAGVAVDAAGHRTPLPPGAPTARRITLTGGGDSWRITAISKA